MSERFEVTDAWRPDMPIASRGTDIVAGISVPISTAISKAIDFAMENCEPYLFNHAMRSWLFAERIAQLRSIDHDPEVLALGTVLHDVTLNERFSGPRRFEVEAADLSRTFALALGFDKRRAQLIWDSVALNSTPSIGLYKEHEVSLCTAGICLDVIGLQYSAMSPVEIAQVVAAYPRLSFKRRLTACICHIAEAAPQTTYDSFIRDFGEKFVPKYEPPSLVDMLWNSPFDQ